MMKRRAAGLFLLLSATACSATPTSATRAPSPADACEFPPEADSKAIDFADVKVVVTVDAAGSATAVRVLEDPGNGFGRAAVKCAMAQTYVPALDADGIARPATTPPIRIRFKR